jgi:hypothetical protein
MKIKLGSFITEAHGKIGGHYIQHSSQGVTLSRKRTGSQTSFRSASQFSQLIQQYSRTWKTLSSAQRKTWTQLYGSSLKGFNQYVTQNAYRSIAGAPSAATVNNAQQNRDLSFVSFTYTQGSQRIDITLTTTGAGTRNRIVQVRDYQPTRARSVNSGWFTFVVSMANTSPTFTISDAIKAHGWQVTNQTTFLLRVIQCMSNTHEVTYMPIVRITTGQ